MSVELTELNTGLQTGEVVERDEQQRRNERGVKSGLRSKIWMILAILFAAVAIVFIVLFTTQSTSDSSEESCSSTERVCTEINSQPSNYQKKACNEVVFPSRPSTIPSTPSSWQKTNCFANLSAEAAYDLALVGAGIGSAYVCNELRFGHAHNHTITVFEAGDNVGGRLLSAFQGGALGIPVRPFNSETNLAPPEYGGMRIATKYPLVFNQVILLWEEYFKSRDNDLCSLEFCKSPKDPYKCCEGLLTPMNVGNVAYFNRRTALGPTLENSSLKELNPLYDDFNETYTVAHIDNYANYSAFVNCILLAVGVKNYTGIVTESGNIPATQGFKEACNPASCKKVSNAFCMLCRKFPEPAAAAVSCSGYDTDPNILSTNSVISLMDEVLNIEGKTFLYLFTVGYQRLVQELFSGTMSGNVTKGEGLNQYHTLDIAPQFRKKLIAIGVGKGHFNNAVERARVLATKQVEKYQGKATNTDDNGPYKPIRLKFEDGSITTSHMAYMTMLPYDTVDKVEGLEPWKNVILNSTNPTSLVKAVLAWDTFSLADELKLKPCVVIKNGVAEGGPCDRIILDGNSTKPNSQVVRQAWLWDHKQILLYQIGYKGTPSQNGIELANKFGTEAFVKKAVDELQMAVSQYGIVIPPPSWFRIKSWPKGTILNSWALTVKDPAQLSEHFRRPFGKNVKVWYGNSEMARDGDLHGWAEGALSMANTSLPELKTELSMLKAANQQKS